MKKQEVWYAQTDVLWGGICCNDAKRSGRRKHQRPARKGASNPGHAPLLGHSHPPLVGLPEVVPGVRAHAVSADPQNEPDAGDDETDGEDHELDAGEDEGDGAVGETIDLGFDGELGHAEVAHDHILGEDTGDEGGFVGRDIGSDDLAVGVGCLEGDDGHDERLELSPACGG